MAYITLGTSTQLQIKVPTLGSTDWGDVMRTDTFLKMAEHAHTGSADGSQIATGAIAADAITGAKILLANAEYLRGRNQANSGDINILRVTTADLIEFGVSLIAPAVSTSLITTEATAITLADNQSTITAGVVTLGTNESCKVAYRIERNGDVQHGEVTFTDVDTVPSESFQGIDVGVTFTVSSGALFYETTSTGSTASLTYIVTKE